MTDDLCGHFLQTHDGNGYVCQRPSGHDTLHRWDWQPSDGGEEERGRVWTDDGVDFLEGPYDATAGPKGHVICRDQFVDAAESVIACVRPKGHSGQHGNYHDEHGPTYWTGYEALPAALTTWSKEPPIELDIIHADFEVVITNNAGTPKAIRLNGLEIPRVKEMTVEYSHDNARVVILEIYASSLKEVSE